MNEEQGPGWQRWVSSRHRASRDPATGEWRVETWRLHERSNSGPMTVRAYVEALPERTYPEVVETIAGSRGSDMAVFELEDAGEVHVFALRCVLLAQLPEIVALPLTPRAERQAIRDAFPLYCEIMDTPRFSWDTPAYRMACGNLGFDPDDGRPEYQREDGPLVEALQNWIIDPVRPFSADQINVGQVLELIRMDRQPSPTLYDQVRRQLPLYRRINLPFLAEIERRVAA
ncbi:hypothetical protein [Aureimonas sp. AU20]|uniref:hypothetical protein n=1 Tax=Aureimonas sp. AU20 TaxID=1349819 RepID=UPI00071F306D|nr:hypothetical protein [Aureimonas sp. AU20]ALN75801.1 hypothetical protein M673_23910 [Aureimonas sp. AU20]